MTRRRTIALLALLAYSGLVFGASSGAPPGAILALGLPDWVLHLAEYAVFGFLAARWLSLETGSARTWALVGGAALLALLWGTIDELHQATVPGRDASAADVAADVVGGTLGALLLAAARRRCGGGG